MELRDHHLHLSLPSARTPLSRRLAAHLRRFGLDRSLAAGDDPRSSALLACRAEQLRSTATRRRIAVALRGVVRAADRPVAFSAAVSSSPCVRALRSPLLALAARLETDPHVGVRGLALANLLVTDGASPLFGSSTVDELEDALETVRAGLDA